jgi:hypothetical protein
LGGRFVGAQATLFSSKLVSKKCGNYTTQFMFGGRLGVSQTGLELGRRPQQHFVGFFHKIKVRQQIGRKASIQAVCEE